MDFSQFPKHHAVLVTHSNRMEYGNALWDQLSKLSPAHIYFNQTVFDIETARSIISWAQSPYNDERVALISFHTAGLPAQNAMLKILEEPRAKTRFILLTTDTSNLIPTVLSRVHHIHIDESVVGDRQKEYANEFLQTSHAARMKLPHVVELLTRVDEEGRKDRESVKAYILSLADTLRGKAESRYVTETLQVASYASDPSASGKALLEYLALLLPRIK